MFLLPYCFHPVDTDAVFLISVYIKNINYAYKNTTLRITENTSFTKHIFVMSD